MVKPTEKKPNHLLKENSPYLLQHAYNPVDWHPWGNEALKLAIGQHKLLVISIGYAACHWCHVMEHESFEDDEVAMAMNRDFISIKVDREERPDIDQLYMKAAYASTGRGGWPLNVIALNDQRPLFAGTYFSRHDWLHILKYFADLHHAHPEALLQQASEIGKGMTRQNFQKFAEEKVSLGTLIPDEIFASWEVDLDFKNGGTLGAPKFPMPANIGYLLKYGSQFQNQKALEHALLSLDRMAMGGIYDHLGGGFCRYSVDQFWHVPHFEKMLYDNAQLISLYSHGFAVSGKEAYRKVAEESVAFIERELTGQDGLYYASLDADSGGTEGAYYAWTNEEIRKYPDDDPELFLAFYSCEENGNWENGRNVLYKSMDEAEFATNHHLTPGQLTAIIEHHKHLLLKDRGNRIRPGTDIKILTCWNALMISALADAAKAFGRPGWLEKAIAAATYYRDHAYERKGKLWRNSQAGSFAISGFLDDYGFLIKSFLDIYQSTFDNSWLAAADFLTQQVLVHFTAGDGPFFNLSSDEEPRLVQETIELSDNVIPSSNSQVARNCFILGHLLENELYTQRAATMLKTMAPQIIRNPSFHANWACLLVDLLSGPTVVKITGADRLLRLHEFSGFYLPGVIFSSGSVSADEKTLIYVCHGKTCFSPVETVQEALQMVRIP